MLHRYFILLAYDGTQYHGWQIQPNGVSVQSEMEKALAVCFCTDIPLTAAGRTDTGVHAHEMYAHFDLPQAATEEDISQALWKINNLLPSDISVLDIIAVASDAHARFDAVSRTYQYHILTHKNPFKERFAWYWQGKLDLEVMNSAAEIIMGVHDFQCFSKVHTDVSNFICDVHYARWKVLRDEMVFTITANRFLRNMVRAVVGTLFDIGRGKIAVEDMEMIMASRNRSQAGASVPAKGLFLTKINYPYPLLGVSNLH